MGNICCKEDNRTPEMNQSGIRPPSPKQSNVSHLTIKSNQDQEEKKVSEGIIFVSAYNPNIQDNNYQQDQQRLDEELRQQQLLAQKTEEEQRQRIKIEEEQKQKIQKEKEEAAKTMVNGEFTTINFMESGQEAKYQGQYYFYNQLQIPHGKGQIKYSNRNYTIDGNFLHGKLIAIFKLIFDDNSIYVGETLNEVPHGKGTHTFSDDLQYTGMYEKGLMHGQGVMKFENKLYEGDFNKNKITGKFKVTDLGTKETYVGDLVEGLKDGQGVITDKRGKVLQSGKFKNGYLQKK